MLRSGFAVVVAVALSLAPASSAGTRHPGPGHGHLSDPVPGVALQWYDITNQTVSAAAFAEPVTQSRVWAVSWLAAARAVGAGHSPIYSDSAFAQALHDTLVAQVPSQQTQLDADLASTLASIPDGPAKSAGLAAGQQAASAILAQRAGDGLDTASLDIPFTPPAPGPGVWQPTPPTFGPAIRAGEGGARAFLLARNDQFDPGPPPSLSSQTYLNALAEVRALGSAGSTVRTPQQTDVALFWEPASNVLYVQVLRAIVADLQRPLAWQARFIAAFHAITTDAQIATYNAKYRYLFWRPVTAIRTGSVAPDPSWTPLFATPRHPEYPSGHTTYAGAAQVVLSAFLGPRAPAPISVTSPTDPGSTHIFQDWSTITQENIDGRVWEGIHFRFSDNTGAHLGGEVAVYDLLRLRSLGL